MGMVTHTLQIRTGARDWEGYAVRLFPARLPLVARGKEDALVFATGGFVGLAG